MESISATLLLLAAAYFTGLTRFVQIRRFFSALSMPFRKGDGDAGGVSPLQAAATSLAATIGTGNIAGVGGAILLGGPGAVFWMWVSSLLGMALKYAEIVLSMRFRAQDASGAPIGGPMILFRRALPEGARWLSTVFALCGTAAAFGMGNLVQANTVADGVSALCTALGAASPRLLTGARLLTGLCLAALLYAVLLGGAQRVGRLNAVLVPVMSALYLLLSAILLIGCREALPTALSGIVRCAFRPEAVLGGAAGITFRTAFRTGLSRGVFTHEAGLGTAGIAHSGATGISPVQQGLFGVFEVFFDGLICTLTALVVLSSGIPLPFGSSENMAPVVAAFATAFGAPGASGFLALSLMLFAFSSMVSFAYYGARCVEFLFGMRALHLYRPLFAVCAIFGAVLGGGAVWRAAETANAAMAIPNLIGMVWVVRRHGRRILQ